MRTAIIFPLLSRIKSYRTILFFVHLCLTPQGLTPYKSRH